MSLVKLRFFSTFMAIMSEIYFSLLFFQLL